MLAAQISACAAGRGGGAAVVRSVGRRRMSKTRAMPGTTRRLARPVPGIGDAARAEGAARWAGAVQFGWARRGQTEIRRESEFPFVFKLEFARRARLLPRLLV